MAQINSLMHDLGLEWQLIVAQMAAFLVLLWLLKKYLFGALGKMIEARREGFATQHDELEEQLHHLKYLEAQHEAKLKELNEQRAKLLEDAAAQGRQQAQEMTDAAQASAEAMLEKTRRELEREKAKALVELRQQVAELAVLGATKLLRRELNEADQSAFVDQFTRELETYESPGPG